ncbi:unnamed protein product, partial [Hapterophycus canaliculatus]
GTTHANAYFGAGAAFAVMVTLFFFFYALSLHGLKGGRELKSLNYNELGTYTTKLEDQEGKPSEVELQFNKDGSLGA